MRDAKEDMLRSFGRAFRLVEAWVEADLVETARRAAEAGFGGSVEFMLVSVLANAESPLPLYEFSVRCRSSRRAVLRFGRLRLALERMEKSGLVINLGSIQRPRYQLNLINDEARLLVSIFGGGNGSGLVMTQPVAASVKVEPTLSAPR
jgi:hypothetical protein